MRPQTATLPLRILVVDDYPELTASMATLLRRWGHDVQTALDGPEALRVAAAYHPDVVLLDVSLPGMDGYQVARRLRNDPGQPRVFVVSITGYGGEGEAQRSREAGCDDHLLKPVDPDILEHLLADRQAAPEAEQVASPPPRRDVSELAESRLRGHPFFALRQISCAYRDGVLTLRGCLPTYYLKQLAQSAVAPIDGVERINNEIEILGSVRALSN